MSHQEAPAGVGALIQSQLEQQRESISRELCTIPTPIPGCDVHVNRLLEDRSEVVDALQRFIRLRRSGASSAALVEFARSCKWLDAAGLERLASAEPPTRTLAPR